MRSATVSFSRMIGDSWNRMLNLCFQPFDPTRWLVMGFCAWLAVLTETGCGGLQLAIPDNPGREIGHLFKARISEFIATYGWILIPVGAVLLVLLLAVGLIVLWLSSRGKFMLLDNVITGEARVSRPWQAYRIEGRSLFLWRLGLGLVSSGLIGLIVLAGTAAGVFIHRSQGVSAAFIATVTLGGFLLIAAGVAVGYVYLFTEDFLIPIMYKQRIGAMTAWRKCCTLFSAHPAVFVLFGIVKFGIGIITAMALMLLTLLTCCCLSCILIIPYINAVVLLPIYIFYRMLGPALLEQVEAQPELSEI